MKKLILLLSMLIIKSSIHAQPWELDNTIFNPSGVPSLSFAQPRFADLDSDGDFDMILGHISDTPIYFKNIGTKFNPKFQKDESVLANVTYLSAEMGVCADLNDDGLLDFISGGYTGLHFYKNNGTVNNPNFTEAENPFTSLNVGNTPVPTLADLDADNDLDLAVGLGEDGRVIYYENIGSPESPQFSQNNSISFFDVGLYAYPYFYDLDKDNDYDLLIGKDGHNFSYFENTGDSSSFTWTNRNSLFQNLGSDTYWNSPSLVDLNGDNKTDLVYGTADGPIFYYTNSGSNATPNWTINNTVFGGSIDIGGASSPVFFDYDNDGDLDLFSGSQLGDIKYFENIGSKKAPAWKDRSSMFSVIDHSIYSAVSVGDINNDLLPDIFVGDLSGNIYLHMQTQNGFVSAQSGISKNFGGFSVPRLIDIDFDNDLDLVVGNEDGDLFFFENQGSIDSAKWVERTEVFESISISGGNAVPYLADIDNDGDYDLFVGNLFGDIKFYEFTENGWKENSSAYSEIFVDQNASPSLADLDDDGDYDLIVGNYEGTFSYYRNLSVTSVDEISITPTNFELRQNYPNPFNPTTSIEYSLPSNEYVSLKVYDILGNEVASLVDEQKTAGTYKVSFNASNLSSGVYLYKLLTGSNTQIKKMILLR